MGLLDDAIREHLELKRRHGADPTEVARQESEALGAARRAAETMPEPDLEDDAPGAGEELLDAPAFQAEPEWEHEPEPEPEPVVRRREREPEPEPDFEPEPEPDFEPEPEPAPRARRREPDPVDEPDEMEIRRRESETEADVLEGTPEFLEETPEHDRLWFEQRPPRDFDFDD
jgi:hypothetical protein